MTPRALSLAIPGTLLTAAYTVVVSDVNHPAVALYASLTALAAAVAFAVSWRLAFRPWLPARIPLTDLRLRRDPEGGRP